MELNTRELIRAVEHILNQNDVAYVDEGKVYASQNDRTVLVSVAGSTSAKRAEIMEGVSVVVDQRVLLLRLPRQNRLIVIGGFTGQGAATTDWKMNAVAPPNNFTATAMQGFILLEWDYPALFDVVFEVQVNTVGSADGNETSIAITKGATVIYPLAGGLTRYFRIRTGKEGFVSGWGAWISQTADFVDAEMLLGTLLSGVASGSGQDGQTYVYDSALDQFVLSTVSGGPGGTGDERLTWIGL